MYICTLKRGDGSVLDTQAVQEQDGKLLDSQCTNPSPGVQRRSRTQTQPMMSTDMVSPIISAAKTSN